MAVSLIKEMTNTWQPEKYHNEYCEILIKWLEKKTKELIKNKPTKRSTNSIPNKSDVVDFISLFKESMKKKDKTQLKLLNLRLLEKSDRVIKTLISV